MTQKELRDRYSYEDGKFKNSKGVLIKGYLNKRTGYLNFSAPGNEKAGYHRAIWLWHFGFLPKIIDHIDRNPLNNKIENLRAATPEMSCANRKSKKKFKGVYFEKRTGRFQARLKQRSLGTFWTEQDAARAYDSAAISIFGEFACTNF